MTLNWGGVSLTPGPVLPQVIREWLESRPPSSTPLPPSRQGTAPTRSSVQHFHRPGNVPLAPQTDPPRCCLTHPEGPGSSSQPFDLSFPTPNPFFFFFLLPETDTTELNIYKKPPIYRQKGGWGGEGSVPWDGVSRDAASPSLCPPDHHSSAHHGKHLIEDLIIESSKFPAAQPPDPNQPAKIETDYWPCPPSLAVVGRWEQRGFPTWRPQGGLGMSGTSPLFPQRRSGGGGWRPREGRRRMRI